ncbi:unnamed protein product [Ectocarpus sp. 12 AP-2014]
MVVLTPNSGYLNSGDCFVAQYGIGRRNNHINGEILVRKISPPPCFPGFNFQSPRSHEAHALPGVTRIHARVDCTLPRIGFTLSEGFVTQSLAKGFIPFEMNPPTV